MAGDGRSVPVRTGTTRVAPDVAIAFLQVLILARSPHATTQAASGSVPEDVSAASSPGDSPAAGAQRVASAGGVPSTGTQQASAGTATGSAARSSPAQPSGGRVG